MKIEIENTIKKINDLIDNAEKDLKANEVMQLSQSALNLANTAATLDHIKNKE